ncbi:MAG TPA: hypothetical protein VMX75_11540 [Spirochaetia bacterium]|nr:hypothetical protein [Spirochaetia bacterium]
MKERAEKLLDLLPKEGFIKLTGGVNKKLTKEQKTALIRKGNDLFNRGNIDLAKRIFMTTGYSDGLMRLGDYYYKKNQVLEAFRMYHLAPSKRSIEHMVEKMASVVRTWLNETKEG